MNNIWDFQEKVGKRLTRWSWLSGFLGLSMILDLYAPIRAVGKQFILWGFIDWLIAKYAKRQVTKKQGAPEASGPSTQKKMAKKLSRLLWFNSFLDVGYMAYGRHLIKTADETKRGAGIGIFIQGAFLFIFDIYHAWQVRHFK